MCICAKNINFWCKDCQLFSRSCLKRYCDISLINCIYDYLSLNRLMLYYIIYWLFQTIYVQNMFHKLHITGSLFCHWCHDRRDPRYFTRRIILSEMVALRHLLFARFILVYVPSRNAGSSFRHDREYCYGNFGIRILLTSMFATWNFETSPPDSDRI